MIGIGIVTYDRETEYNDCVDSILINPPSSEYKIFSIKDGGKDPYRNPRPEGNLISLDNNIGVGKTKNLLIKSMLQAGCEFLFLIEDDCSIVNEHVWDYCIEFSKHTGLLHFNWDDYRGDDTHQNVQPAQFPKFSAIISFNVEASFSFFEKRFVEEILFDEEYMNAWEHIDLEMQGFRKGFLPGFRSFTSPKNLKHYLKMNDNGRSSIVGREDHHSNIIQGYHHWLKKWEKPVTHFGPLEEMVYIKNMKQITLKYARR